MTSDLFSEIIVELEDEISELKTKLSMMTDERDIAITHNPVVKECLTACLRTLQELRCYDDGFYFAHTGRIEQVEACLSLFVTEEKK